MAIVCVLSVFNGFSALSYSQLSRIDPEIKVVPASGKVIADADSLALLLEKLPSVAAALPTIEEQALAIFNGNQMPVRIKGLPQNYSQVVDYAPMIIDGDCLLADSLGDFALLSVGTAITLQARPGASHLLEIYLPRRRGNINPANPMAAFRGDSLIVGGVYQADQAEYDADMIALPLGNARRLLEYDSQASAIEAVSAPGYSTAKAMAEISSVLGEGFQVKDRQMQQQHAFRMISIEKWITFMMLAFILVIASFNIIST